MIGDGHRSAGSLDRVSRSRLVALLLAACVALAFAAFGMRGAGSALDPIDSGTDGNGSESAAPQAKAPNVIVILTDDLDTSLLPYVPNVNALIRDQGASFTNFYVEQSSCCPSRASILSGLYAHNHGVIGNVWPEGGYDRWKPVSYTHLTLPTILRV